MRPKGRWPVGLDKRAFAGEVHKLTGGMGNRRMIRLTNAFGKKGGEPCACDVDLFHALQFRAYPSDAEDHACDGIRASLLSSGKCLIW
jgi:hypothetical protein